MTGPWEKYAAPQEDGPWAKYATEAAEKPADAPSFGQMFKNEVLNSLPAQMLFGGVRGAGSIGATAIRPFETGQENAERRQSMTDVLRGFGANPDSLAFQGGKLGTEIAGTSGVGSALALPFRALPAVQKALQTAGMTTGLPRVTLGQKAADLTLRTAAGGATGFGMAGLVDPEAATTGATIGAVLPGALQAVGAGARAVGSAMRGGAPKPTPEMLNTAKQSMQQGYVIPPASVNPSFKNRMIESIAGKHETAQMAATANQNVTDSLIRKTLNMPANAPINQEALQAYRTAQYQAGYEPVKQLGMVPAGNKFNDTLDGIVKQFTGKGTIPAIAKEKQQLTELVNSHKSAGFDSADAVDAIKSLRESADDAFRQGNGALGKTYRAVAKAYEDAIDDVLQSTEQGGLLNAYRAARKNIAQAHTIEKGLREGAGTVDARAIGRELQKGKPLTGDLRAIGEFGNVFNKAAQPPQLIGSPGVNNLKPALSLLAGAAGGAAMGPAGFALGAANYLAPPVARSIMFSPRFQQGLLGAGQQGSGAMQGLLEQQLLRTAPLLSAQ